MTTTTPLHEVRCLLTPEERGYILQSHEDDTLAAMGRRVAWFNSKLLATTWGKLYSFHGYKPTPATKGEAMALCRWVESGPLENNIVPLTPAVQQWNGERYVLVVEACPFCSERHEHSGLSSRAQYFSLWAEPHCGGSYVLVDTTTYELAETTGEDGEAEDGETGTSEGGRPRIVRGAGQAQPRARAEPAASPSLQGGTEGALEANALRWHDVSVHRRCKWGRQGDSYPFSWCKCTNSTRQGHWQGRQGASSCKCRNSREEFSETGKLTGKDGKAPTFANAKVQRRSFSNLKS